MKLKDQVCSLELAKQLKKLGVKQESLYHWDQQFGDWLLVTDRNLADHNRHYDCSAFTVAELGEMMEFNSCTVKTINGYEGLTNLNKIVMTTGIIEESEADARAKTLIYLKENNLCTK